MKLRIVDGPNMVDEKGREITDVQFYEPDGSIAMATGRGVLDQGPYNPVMEIDFPDLLVKRTMDFELGVPVLVKTNQGEKARGPKRGILYLPYREEDWSKTDITSNGGVRYNFKYVQHENTTNGWTVMELIGKEPKEENARFLDGVNSVRVSLGLPETPMNEEAGLLKKRDEVVQVVKNFLEDMEFLDTSATMTELQSMSDGQAPGNGLMGST